MSAAEPTAAWSRRAYAVLVVLAYPRQFRRLHGDDMIGTFGALLQRATHENGWGGWLRQWLLSLRDLAANGATLRFSRVRASDERVAAVRSRAGHRSSGPSGREPGGWRRIVDAALGDLRYGLRSLRLQPTFALVGVVTLALGIGATTAIFSVVNGVLLRPLPYADADRLVQIRATDRDGVVHWTSFPDFEDWRASEALSGAAGATFALSETVLGAAEPLRADLVAVTAGFWQEFGVSALSGRMMAPDEHREGASQVAVVSESFWRNELGAQDLTALTLRFGGRSVVVVGVVPQAAALVTGGDLWYPLEPNPRSSLTLRGTRWLRVFGRLAPGVADAAARAELSTITERANGEVDPRFAFRGVQLMPLRTVLVGPVDRSLRLLWGGSALVLLVACTNLVSMLMARSASRGAELSVRGALGASRGRLVRQLLTENAILVAVGALLGIGLAQQVVRVLRLGGEGAVPRLAGVTLDARVLGFAALTALLTTILVGLLPAIRATRPDARLSGIRGGGASAGSRSGWSLLVAAEVAFAVVLVLGAGLLLRSLSNVLNDDLGFQADGVMTVQLNSSLDRFETEVELADYLDGVLDVLRGVPGFTAVGLTSHTPLDAGNYASPINFEDGSRSSGVFGYRVVGGDYFAILGIPILEGRSFLPTDDAQSAHVVVVNRSFAQQNWPDESALGKVISVSGMDAHRDRELTVVGVVGEARHWSQPPGSQAEYFVPLRQRAFVAGQKSVVVATMAGEVGALADTVRARLREFDPELPVELSSMSARLGNTVADRGFVAAILGAFAVVALVLAAIGIYGVVSYALASRRHEFGVRKAIGATAGRLRVHLMLGAMSPVAVGVAAGLLGAALLSRSLAGMLYALDPLDPATIAQTGVVLAIAALGACWGPAQRAARVDPAEAMRGD